jgi:putative transposase
VIFARVERDPGSTSCSCGNDDLNSCAPQVQRRVHARESSLLLPLTITDFASRYLVACEALSTTQERYAFGVFERAFREFGLPQAIRTDNGVPFASAHALYGLSKLSVWWLRLGIQLERIMPGHPEQNGRHERMHLTLKSEATRPAAANVLQQQGRFDAFVHRYNHERPHQALNMKTPASLYTPLNARIHRARGARVSVP